MKQNVSVNRAALVLRVGLGLVFLSGGLAKLGKLLNPATADAMVATYLGPLGYINSFFIEYLFPSGLSPFGFLTGLSAFEAASGLALILGLAVRPLALMYGFLMWTFVIALPTATVPGLAVDVKTYTSPAILVMIRDIAISGLSFVLYNLGSGELSLDKKLFRAGTREVDWNALGLLVRLSVGFVLVVGGLFHGLDHIQSFKTPAILLTGLGVLVISGVGIRYVAMAIIAVLSVYMMQKFSLDASIVKNLNSVKREFALVAAAILLTLFGGGQSYRLPLPVRSK